MSLTPKVFGSPAAIWLVYGDLEHDDKHSNFPEVTWCEDAQFDSDVMYVRADLTEIEQLKAENKRLRAAKCPTWSFIRTLLEQGAAIRQDYDAGKFGDSYEAYSARIAEAAREREDALTALEQKP